MLRAFGVISGGVCLLAVFLVLALHAGPARRYVAHRLIAYLAANQIELQADDLRYDLLRLSADVRNVRLRSAAAPDLPVFATVQHARLNLSPLAALRGDLLVQSGLVEVADVHYVVDADGRDNLPRLVIPSDEARKPLSYLIARLSVARARVRYTNAAQQVEISVPLSLELRGNARTRRHRVHFESTGGEASIQNRATSFDRITGVLEFGQDDIPEFDVTLEANAPWGAVVANGQVALGPQRRSRLHAEIRSVDAATLMRVFEFPSVIDTRVDGKLDVEWPGLDYLDASGSAIATFTPTTRGPTHGRVPLHGRLAAERRGRMLVADVPNLVIAGVNIAGRVEVTDTRRLHGKLRANVRDLAPTISAVETFLGKPRGSLQPAAIAGAALVDARIGGTLDEPTLHATLTAPAVSTGDAHGITLAADVVLTPTTLTIARADAYWQGARAALSGNVGFTGVQQLNLVLDASATDLQTLARRAYAFDRVVSGVVTARGRIGGTVARPLASVTISAADLNAFEEQFGSLNAELAIAGRDVRLTRLLIDKPQPDSIGRITATGSYNLDRKTYSVELDSENVRLLALRLPGGQQIRGDVELTGKAAGTLAAPGGTVRLAIDALQVDDLQLGRAVIAGTVANHRAEVTATAERFNVDAKAFVNLARPWATTLSARANDLELETLPLGLETPLAGRLRATVNATGDLADPAGVRAVASIDTMEGSWKGHAFTVATTGELRYENEHLDIGRVQLTVRDSSLVASGQLPLTRRAAAGDLAIEAHANLATLAQLLPSNTDLAADGVATLAGSLRGTWQSITPDLAVTVENGVVLSRVLESPVSHLQLHARVEDGALEVQRLTGNWGSAIVEGTATIPLELLPSLPIEIARRTGPATLKATVQDLNPAAIPGAPAGVSGRIAADVDLSAARGDLASLAGNVVVRQLEIALDRTTLNQQEPSRISIGSGAATIEHFALSGSAGTVAASGTVGFIGNQSIDVKADGTFNVGALSALDESIRSDGTATWKLGAAGSLIAPELNGTLNLVDATIASEELAVAATNVNAHIDVTGARMELTRLSGELNGGTFQGAGHVTVANQSLGDVDLQFSANDVAYDAPLDLRSLSNATIRITRHDDELVVAGQVTITEAGLTADTNLNELFAALSAPRTLDQTEGRNAAFERIRFDINIGTATPAIVENNLARAEIDADLRVVGTPNMPGLTGRLTIAEGGQLTLNARRYQVERGVITFVDERRIAPSFDLALYTQASNYDVRVGVAGSPDKTETTWTSDPPLPETDIMALLVTGRTLDEMRGEESEVARTQAMSYLTGRVGSKFGRGIEKATGISEVRIEPVLIANETDPTARLTVGQNVTDQMKLVYSTNLADSNDQIWIVEYDVTRRFQTRAVREREDDTYRGDFRHDIRFGGEKAPRRQTRRHPTITALKVTTDGGFDEAILRERFSLEAGDEYEFFAARSGLERIEKLYLESGYLQSRVRIDRHSANDTVDLALRVTKGPRVDLRFEGADPSKDIREKVRAAWHRGVFDRQRGSDSAEVLRGWLMNDNYLQPTVEYDVADRADERQVVFHIQPGPRYEQVVLAFEGAAAIDPARLDDIIEDEHLEQQLFTDPADVAGVLRRYYYEQGFLSADVAPPRYDFQGTTARVVVVVREGPRFVVRNVTPLGNTVYAANEIAKQLPVVVGAPFLPAEADHALERIRDLYWRKGYNEARSEYSLVVDRETGAVDVTFTVTEGRQSVVATIEVQGSRRTSEQLVREQIELAPFQPLDLAVLARSRRNLYSTGAFSIADITREDVAGNDNGVQKAVRVNVAVREVEPVQLRYGLSYDSDGGLGGILDLSIHNSLGNARVAGVQGRYDSEVRDARIYVSQPTLRSWPRKTIASAYFREDLNPPTDETDPFDISRSGASIQQDVQFRRSYTWSYGYRYELATTLEPSLGAGVTETVRLSPLSTTLTRETRDEVLDASKGTFFSQAFAYSPGWLGSDRPYVKYYGQYFHYFPLRSPRREPFGDEILRPRLVFASGVRVGLAHGLGGDTPTSERFYAGGGTTLRGFEQNAVGPIANDVPAGGNAVLVLNNELRLPLVSILDGVLFVDVGNVFSKINDFSFTDLRETAGFGLRLRTRWLLLRGDYGFVLDPREGERRSRFYFNIGQAF